MSRLLSKYKNFMERDSKLFENFDLSQKLDPLFFFYTWDKPVITIGKIQRNRKKLIEEAHNLSIETLIRPTGGRAVLHGGDICYSFIGAQSDPIYGGKLSESFKAVNCLVIDLFNKILGKEFLTKGSKAVGETSSFNCFDSSICNEGLYDSNKIIGAAQAMGKRAFIQQGSIQLNKVDRDLEYFKSQKTLSELSGKEFNLEDLCEQLNLLSKGLASVSKETEIQMSLRDEISQ